MLLEIILVLLPVILFAFIYKKYARKIKLSREFASPPTLPLLGSAHLIIGKKPEEYVWIFLRWIQKYGQTIAVWLGPEFNILMGDVKDVETILGSMKFIEKAGEYKMLRPWLREGLLISKGKKWHQRRKIITPAFHFKILERFIDVFEYQGNTLIASLLKLKENENIDLYNYISLYTLDVICETAMGIQLNAQKDSDSDYVRAVKIISKVLHKRMFDIFHRNDFLFQFTPLARQQKIALDILHKFSEKIIASRRQELLQKEKVTNNTKSEDDIGSKKKIAFLDILLQSEIDGEPLSDLDIREEVDTFMFEGHDTTSSAITFCLYNLAKYPHTQTKCFDEIKSIFGNDKTTPVTYEQLCNMHYVELVIKETLRLYPPVPMFGRIVTEECIINGKTVPADSNIGICPGIMGRNEYFFPNPYEFIPERFDATTNIEKKNPYAYIPFSAGPRNCIGQKFAMLEIKSIISKILRHFEVEYPSKAEPILVAELILRTKNVLKFRLKPRKY